MFEDIKNIKSTGKELKEFGITIGVILLLLGAFALWRGKEISAYLLGIGALFIALGLVFPAVLKPLQKVWMSFSIIIGFFVSRVVLFILFYAVLTPMGLITKLLGKDILDQKIDKNLPSYWHDVPAGPKDKKTYENQY